MALRRFHLSSQGGHVEEHDAITKAIYVLDARVKVALMIGSASVGMNVALLICILTGWIS